MDVVVEPEPRVNAPAAIRGALWRMAPPCAWMVAGGFFLDAMGMNGTPALLAYVLAALAVALGHGALRWLNRGRDLWAREHVVDLFLRLPVLYAEHAGG